MPTITLSATAESLLRTLVGPGRVDVTPENQDAFRELARAGIVVPVSTFARGEESIRPIHRGGVGPPGRMARSPSLRRLGATGSVLGPRVFGPAHGSEYGTRATQPPSKPSLKVC